MAKTVKTTKKKVQSSDKKKVQTRTISPKSMVSSEKKSSQLTTKKATVKGKTKSEKLVSPKQPVVKSSVVSIEIKPTPTVRTESSKASLLETLNHQINVVSSTLSQVINDNKEANETITQTMSLNRASVMFQHLVAEMIEDQLSELLPTLITLRNDIQGLELGEWKEEEFQNYCLETLDQVFSKVGVNAYDARIGEVFDPVIHTAIAETHLEDQENNVVSEQIQPGYRSRRGKILMPAKVRVNRRT